MAGGTPAFGESYATTSRTLTFRMTVRDNKPGGGGVDWASVNVTTTNTAGPFTVTAPAAASWAGGSSQTVTWNVANTTAAPVSCANVKVSLSTDGGSTFPTVLLPSTPNDGSESVGIPNTPTTTARIKVECVGNVFFNVSRPNFTITPGVTPAPTVTAITPNLGPVAGGTAVTITGANFVATPTVSLGGTPATGVTWVNGNTLTATTGARASGGGLVDLVVTNPDTQTGQLANAFTYLDTTTALSFYTATPCRLIDTRDPVGPLAGPALAASPAERTFTVPAGTCGVPADAKALSTNVVVVTPTAAGDLKIVPQNSNLTSAQTMFFSTGQTRANNLLLFLSTDGARQFRVRNNAPGTVHFVVDVNGYFK